MTLDSYNIFGDEYHLFNMPLSPLPKVLVSFDGMQSAPTLTTPTLTPTTLRTIEETIYELTSEPQNVPFQAGFKPPPLTSLCNVSVNNNNNNNSNNINNNNNNTTVTTTASNVTLSNVINTNSLNANPQFDLLGLNCGSVAESDSEDSNGSWREGQLNDDQSTTDTSSAATDSTSYQNGGHNMLGNNGSNGSSANNFTAALAAANSAGRGNSSSTSNSATPARRGGGRRPNKNANMSPEEEEKRRIRRERNKLAAARCRKRRVDQTNELTDEVDLLIKKGEDMKKEIEILNATKHQLEYVLQAHRPTCQKVRDDMLSVVTCNGLIAHAPTAMLSAGSTASNGSLHNNNSSNNNNNNNSNSNDSSCGTITGFDASLNSTGRSNSPLDLKPVLTNEQLLQHIKHEPQDGGLDSGSSLDQDGPPAAKRFALPNIATFNASLTTPTGPVSSLNTPITGTAPVSFGSFSMVSSMGGLQSPTLNTLNTLNKLTTPQTRPNTLNVQQPFLHKQPHIDGKAPPTQIEGVPIQTPSAGNFNFDSLMAGGTGLTPVSGPLVPTCSSQNKHPMELPTPTSELESL